MEGAAFVRKLSNSKDEANRISLDRTDSPVPCCVSVKSDKSKGLPNFFKGDHDRDDVFQPETTSQSTVSDLVSIHMKKIILETAKLMKSHLKRKFQCLFEKTAKHQQTRLLNDIYTELYITEGGEGEVNKEHEVRQIEAASRRAETEDKAIRCTDIFKPLPGNSKFIRTVLTKGMAGIGKTISVQKFILDWAEGKANQEVQFIFPFPFRELNLFKKENLSLLQLLQYFFKELKDMPLFDTEESKVVFIFDGLDECRFLLDFHNSKPIFTMHDPAPVDVLLTNLIKGNMFPNALLWITTRPAAADKIPLQYVDRMTEIQGFSDPQKEEYFRKRISDENLANRTLSYLRSCRSLYIMCHIPVLCWILATVLETEFTERSSEEFPKSLTQMYSHFLIIHMSIKKDKYIDGKEPDEDIIFKLGKLSFQQLERGNLIFYEEDLRECGIDVTEASVYSGLCTQIFREESGLHRGKMFSFVHLSIQEFLAAVYVHLCFTVNGKNVLNSTVCDSLKCNAFHFISNRCPLMFDLHKTAVDLTLESKDGYLDLFLRFLLGISMDFNQKVLHILLKNMTTISLNTDETVVYIKKKIEEPWSFYTMLNLFHCLNELNDTSMVEGMKKCLLSGCHPWPPDRDPSKSQCASVLYLLMTAKEREYNLYPNQIIKTDECFKRLMPIIKASKHARLGWCNITSRSCELLGSVLTKSSSLIRDLDLSGNNIQDCGLEMLSKGLANPKCKLEHLKLRNCSLTEKSCAHLASVLSSNSSLRKLNLSGNRILDVGVKTLSGCLGNICSSLEVLRLHNCGLTDESCSYLTKALKLNPSHLRELHLSCNTVGEPGEKLLEALQKDPQYKLERLTTRPQKSWHLDEL